jgi:hypothetical protein
MKKKLYIFLTGLVVLKIVSVMLLPTAFFTNLDNNFGLSVYRIYKPVVHEWRIPYFKDYKTDMNVHIAMHYSVKLNSDLDEKSREFYFSSFKDSINNELAPAVTEAELNNMLFSSVMLGDWQRLQLLVKVFDIDTKQTLTGFDFNGEKINLSKHVNETYGRSLNELVDM